MNIEQQRQDAINKIRSTVNTFKLYRYECDPFQVDKYDEWVAGMLVNMCLIIYPNNEKKASRLLQEIMETYEQREVNYDRLH